MLNRDEFKSFWEIAFRWEDQEPPDQDVPVLPEGVQKRLEQLIWAFRREKIAIRHSSGIPVRHGDLFEMFIMDWTVIRLARCLARKRFPHALLSRRFAYRAEVLKWCEDEYIDLPEFWLTARLNPPDELSATSLSNPEHAAFLNTLLNHANRHKNAKFDSMICQAIARTLWDEHPDLTIEELKQYRAIQIYGNARAYTGKNTVREWLSAVDTRSADAKSGRKKKNP